MHRWPLWRCSRFFRVRRTPPRAAWSPSPDSTQAGWFLLTNRRDRAPTARDPGRCSPGVHLAGPEGRSRTLGRPTLTQGSCRWLRPGPCNCAVPCRSCLDGSSHTPAAALRNPALLCCRRLHNAPHPARRRPRRLQHPARLGGDLRNHPRLLPPRLCPAAAARDRRVCLDGRHVPLQRQCAVVAGGRARHTSRPLAGPTSARRAALRRAAPRHAALPVPATLCTLWADPAPAGHAPATQPWLPTSCVPPPPGALPATGH